MKTVQVVTWVKVMSCDIFISKATRQMVEMSGLSHSKVVIQTSNESNQAMINKWRGEYGGNNISLTDIFGKSWVVLVRR